MLRLYDARDPRSISLIAKRLGLSRGRVREVVVAQAAPSNADAAAKKAKRDLEKARTQRSERDQHWIASRAEAERLLRAGREVVSVSVELGVSVMRVKSLKKSLGPEPNPKSFA